MGLLWELKALISIYKAHSKYLSVDYFISCSYMIKTWLNSDPADCTTFSCCSIIVMVCNLERVYISPCFTWLKMFPGQGPHLLLYIKHGTWHTMEITDACGIELENLVALFHDCWFHQPWPSCSTRGVDSCEFSEAGKGQEGPSGKCWEKSYCEEQMIGR